MQRSPRRHPLAVLRLTIGLSQKEMADLIRCSVFTVQSVELGRLPLSEELALRIADQTNANMEWLMKGKPKAPHVTRPGRLYTKDDYEMAQTRLHMPDDPMFSELVEMTGHSLAEIYAKKLHALLERAVKAGPYPLALWRLDQVLDQIGKDCVLAEEKAAEDKRRKKRK